MELVLLKHGNGFKENEKSAHQQMDIQALAELRVERERERDATVTESARKSTQTHSCNCN